LYTGRELGGEGEKLKQIEVEKEKNGEKSAEGRGGGESRPIDSVL